MFRATTTGFRVGSDAPQKIPLHHSIECRGIFFVSLRTKADNERESPNAHPQKKEIVR